MTNISDDTTLLNDSAALVTTSNTDYDLPFEIPNCPRNRLIVLFFAPNEAIQWIQYTKAHIAIITILFPLIFALGLIANLTFLLVLVKVKEMRTIVNFYLANLAIADLLFVTQTPLKYLIEYLLYPEVNAMSMYKSSVGCILGGAFIYLSLSRPCS